MKRFWMMCMMAVAVLGIVFRSVYAEEATEKQEKYSYLPDGYGEAEKLVEIPYGDGEEALGHQGGYGEKISPKSFWIEKNGAIYILDTIKRAVKRYLPDGTYEKTIPLPEDIYALDIEKIGDFLFVYAESANGYKLYMIDERTPEVYWIVAAVSSWDIEGLYASEGDLYIRSCNGADKKIQLATEDISKEQWLVKNSAPVHISDENTNVFWRKESAGEQVSREEEKGTLNLTCRLDPLGAFYLGKTGNIEYAVTNETDWSYAETRVTKFVDGENTESALTISGKEYFFGFPFKKIYIQNDIVYQMVPVENGIEIYQIPWSSSIQTRFSEEMVEEFREEELQEELQEEELQKEESQGEEHDPTLPDSVDYQNLTEEQKALLEENEKNALTEEKIAQMSARELWEYQLIPLEGVGDGVFSSYPVSYYGMPELYPFQTEGVPYYGRRSSQHYVIGYELYQEPGTRGDRIAVLENPAQTGQEKRYYENYVVLREKIASVHDGF